MIHIIVKGEPDFCITDSHVYYRCKTCWWGLEVCRVCYPAKDDLDQEFVDLHFTKKRKHPAPFMLAGDCYGCNLIGDKQRRIGNMIEKPDRSKGILGNMVEVPTDDIPRTWPHTEHTIVTHKLLPSAIGKTIKEIKESDRLPSQRKNNDTT